MAIRLTSGGAELAMYADTVSERLPAVIPGYGERRSSRRTMYATPVHSRANRALVRTRIWHGVVSWV